MFEQIPHFALQHIGGAFNIVLAYLLHRAIRHLKGFKESLVKANLAFDYVVEQDPGYQRLFDSWKREGAVMPRARSVRAR